ncbi:MAG: filamentous hemagglutinin N-terminal domain-containing protein [Cyanobacteria bacterium P01_A01_bin.135]
MSTATSIKWLATTKRCWGFAPRRGANPLRASFIYDLLLIPLNAQLAGSVGAVLLTWLAGSAPAIGQIRPDATLPERSQVRREGDRFLITGGAQRGGNLFHSFERFSVPTQGMASFQELPPTLDNVVTRVTGRLGSQIDGTIELLQADAQLSDANFLFINPNGIVFGPNAALRLGGSFLASTASQIDFADGTQFRTAGASPSDLLTTTGPVGLQVGGNPGAIANRSIVPLIDASGNIVTFPGTDIPFPGGLQVNSNRTLALVGGDIVLNAGSSISVDSGRIELGSLQSGGVRLQQRPSGWTLDYEDTATFGRIELTELAGVNALTLGDQPGDGIAVRAAQLIVDDAIISTFTEGRGNGGDVEVQAETIVLRNGGSISTATGGRGRAGALRVTASESIQATGGIIIDGRWFPSGLFTDTLDGSTGSGGLTRLQTDTLTLTGGANISTSTRGAGNAGRLQIRAADVTLTGAALAPDGTLFRAAEDGFPRRSGLFVSANPTSEGNGNNLQLTTERLTLQAGALIRAGTFASGDGGDINIRATDYVEVTGRDQEGLAPSLIFAASGGLLEVSPVGFPEATGAGGDINIQTPNLRVTDGGAIAVGSLNPDSAVSDAGSITINGGQVLLDGQGQLLAETASGDGGNISLVLDEALFLRNGSGISTTAGREGAGGNGGDITIRSPFVNAVLTENSNIRANAFTGRGGNVRVTAEGIFGIEPQDQETAFSDITATSTLGISGVIELDTPDVDPSESTAELPSSLVDASRLIAEGCNAAGAFVAQSQGEFINLGRGGITPTPAENLGSAAPLVDLQAPSAWAEETGEAIAPSQNTLITEAQGWVQDPSGAITLVAELPARLRCIQ